MLVYIPKKAKAESIYNAITKQAQWCIFYGSNGGSLGSFGNPGICGNLGSSPPKSGD